MESVKKRKTKEIFGIAQNVFEIELAAIKQVQKQVNDDFVRFIEFVHGISGKLIVCGLGKSGLIGQKISATLSSTGTSSFFMHPTEAFHGDLGSVSSGDVLLMISNSGETEELVRLLPFAIDNQIKTAVICGNLSSTLAENCDFVLSARVEIEACPLKLAPTSSTTACLVLGDAIAVALMNKSNFQREDFAKYHPGGNLGKELLQTASDVMLAYDQTPKVKINDSTLEILDCITSAGYGIAVVVDEMKRVHGVITAGDIMRALHKNPSLESVKIDELITKDPIKAGADTRVIELREMMAEHNITSIVIETQNSELCGLAHYNSLS